MATTGESMAMALERERKYTVPSDVMPDLSFLGPISPVRTFRLEAVYFDTPDLRLFLDAASLRRRTGGDDDGWHLKTPAEDGARLERRLPPGSSWRAPAALRDLLGDLIGDNPLMPVLRLTTTRRVRTLFGEAGGVMAEVCDDRVEARLLISPWTRATWRESELELGHEEPPALLDELDAAMRDHGLTPAEHSSKSQRMLREADTPEDGPPDAAGAARRAIARQLGKLQVGEAAIPHDDPEAVHDTRVALRRLRSILGAYGTLLAPASEVRALRDELRWAGRQLSRARDREVLDEVLAEAFDGAGPDLSAPVAALWASERMGAAPEEAGPALEAVASPRWDAMHGRLVGLVAGRRSRRKGARAALPELRRRAARAVRRVERRLTRALREPDDAAAWHEVRKAAKGARYAFEVVTALDGSGKHDRRDLEAWKSVTEHLGRFQDAQVARHALDTLRRGPGAGAAFAAVDHVLTERAGQDLAEARAVLDASL